MTAPTTELTKDDTRALWHAVEGLHDLVRAMHGEGFSAAQLAGERAKVLAARRALRKVNAIRKRQACEDPRPAPNHELLNGGSHGNS